MARYIKLEDATPYLTKYVPSVEAVERSKVDKAIEEINNCKVYGRTKTARLVSLPEVLDVLKRNIGE